MKEILLGVLLYTVAQIFAWFQTNGLLIHKWLADHIILTSFILGPMIGILFAHGTRYIYQQTDALWVARFLGFAAGYVIFIPLTWYFFGEDPFTLKNIISLALCTALVSIQFLIK